MSPEQRLEAALERAPVDAEALMLAYRDGAAALARARSDPAQSWREEHLNALVGRAHARLFRRAPPPGQRLRRFALGGWARRVRAQAAHTAAAAGIFLAGAGGGYAAVAYDPDAAAELLRPEQLAQIAGWTERGGWLLEARGSAAPLAAFSLFQNNAGAAVESFAAGLSFGAGTAWRLLENGVVHGAIWAAAWHADGLWLVASFTLPHGVLEFPAIFLAGGAGLRAGLALLAPGGRRRRQALIEEGREGALVMLGVLVLLGAAALIEGLVSSRLAGSPWAPVAALPGALVLAWILRSGRRRPAAGSAP